jgi:hypothetical protein
MTDAEIKRAEKDAVADAEWLGLMLLLAFRSSNAAAASRVEFDAAAGRFRFDGRTVAIRSIRSYLNRIEDRFGVRLAMLTAELERGEITLAEWKRAFDRSISSSHILAGSLALGSISVAVRNVTIQNRIAVELAFADDFAEQIRKRKVTSFGMIRARAKRYLMAAHVTYSIVEQSARQVVGIQTQARRVRRASESCPGCVKFSYQWLPINLMPPIGSLQCGGYCRCYLEYR